MSILTNVVHFRGEIVTLYATFKQPTSESAAPSPVRYPQVKVEYAKPTGEIVVMLPFTDMVPISNERFFYNWTIPNNAPLTTYCVVYRGNIGDVEASRTEDLVVGNPNVTTNRCFLRYGPYSYLLLPRVPEVRENPGLPLGEF